MWKESLLISALVVQIYGTTVGFVAYDARNDTYNDLDNLRGTVLGSILVAENEINNLDVTFQVFASNTYQSGLIAIQSDGERVNTELDNIKDLAAASNVDILYCLQGREDYLNDLPGLIQDDMWDCIYAELNEEARVVNASIYLIDVTINLVNALEFQLDACVIDDDLCYSTIADEIALESVRIPRDILVQLQKTEELLAELRVFVETCSQSKTAQYVSAADIILNSITQCVNGLID